MAQVEQAAQAAAETMARASYGRLLALLSARTRDVAGAEDALADAFAAALRTWPVQGVPDRPEAWLLTVARRAQGHASRHGGVRSQAATTLHLLAEEAAGRPDPQAGDTFPDERLRLLFVCAHPAIDAGIRTALMLQTVLGLDAARIAAAFLVTPAAMGQRLSRAKVKIRDAGLGFDIPATHRLADRLDGVLDAIYVAYGSAWDDAAGTDRRRHGLGAEAIWLARLVCALLPDEAEALGLLALLLHCEARADARRDAGGAFIPLSRQDTGRWSAAMLHEGEAMLAAAFARSRIGRFQLEAAIQSAHAARISGAAVDWNAVLVLYDALVQLAPSVGAQVGRAAALAEVAGAAAGLACLDDVASTQSYQPAWVLRAHLLRRLGDPAATIATRRAIALTQDPAVAAFLDRA